MRMSTLSEGLRRSTLSEGLRRSIPSLFKKRGKRILFYAPGSGLGHLSRAHALIRKLLPLTGEEIFLLTNSPLSHLFRQENVTTLHIDTSRGSPKLQHRKIARLIMELAPHVLVADTFPWGMTGELSGLLEGAKFRKVFVRRLLKVDYSRGQAIDECVAAHYDLVLHAEPIGESPLPYSFHLCCPILLRDFDELPGQKEARKIVRAPAGHRVLLTAGRGDPAAIHNFRRLMAWVFLRLKSKGFCIRHAALPAEGNGSMISHFPLLEAMAGADILVSPAGYTLFHESMSLAIPSLYIPQPQKYDDQFTRAGPGAVLSPEELEERLGKLMEKAVEGEFRPAPFINMAGHAARLIAEL
jgi:hypothetical protein